MTTSVTAAERSQLCRLLVYGPGGSVEVAVPAQVPLADLLPAVLGFLGRDLADAGLEHEGWVLQRLGGTPFDEDRSPAELGLHDGDVVYLLPRLAQLPPVDFDDLIDGVATGIEGRPDRWRPAYTRWAFLIACVVPVLGGLVAAYVHRGSPQIALSAAVAAAALLIVAALAGRLLMDGPAAILLGSCAVAYAALAGALIPASVSTAPTAAYVLAAGAATMGGALLATAASGTGRATFTGIALAGFLAALGGLIAMEIPFGHPAAHAAGIVLAAVILLHSFVPIIAFRLAGMRLPPLPTTPEELQLDIEPEPSEEVLDRTADADRHMNGLYLGSSAAATVAMVILARSGTWPAMLLAVDAVVLMLLHARTLVSAAQRGALILPALAYAAAPMMGGLSAGPQRTQAMLVLVVIAVCLLYTAARTLPGLRPLPYWGRAGDLLQSATAIGLLPLLLWVLDIYGYARTLGS